MQAINMENSFCVSETWDSGCTWPTLPLWPSVRRGGLKCPRNMAAELPMQTNFIIMQYSLFGHGQHIFCCKLKLKHKRKLTLRDCACMNNVIHWLFVPSSFTLILITTHYNTGTWKVPRPEGASHAKIVTPRQLISIKPQFVNTKNVPCQ